MIQFTKIKHILLLITISFSTSYAESAFLSNGFVISSQQAEFKDKGGKCYGKIFYPRLANDNKAAMLKINDNILSFVQNYSCGKKFKAAEYKVNYDVKTGSKSYFSVKWTTVAADTPLSDKPIRVESLNFNIKDGKLLSVHDILSPLAKNFMPEIVKLSQNNLASDTSWVQFLHKIDTGKIQFYIFKSKWYIVFNPSKRSNIVTEGKLPGYLVGARG